ncbi:hypothetical protein [Mycoplasma sp. 4044]
MKKQFKFLLPLITVATTSLPLVAISCNSTNEKDPVKEEKWIQPESDLVDKTVEASEDIKITDKNFAWINEMKEDINKSLWINPIEKQRLIADINLTSSSLQTLPFNSEQLKLYMKGMALGELSSNSKLIKFLFVDWTQTFFSKFITHILNPFEQKDEDTTNWISVQKAKANKVSIALSEDPWNLVKIGDEILIEQHKNLDDTIKFLTNKNKLQVITYPAENKTKTLFAFDANNEYINLPQNMVKIENGKYIVSYPGLDKPNEIEIQNPTILNVTKNSNILELKSLAINNQVIYGGFDINLSASKMYDDSMVFLDNKVIDDEDYVSEDTKVENTQNSSNNTNNNQEVTILASMEDFVKNTDFTTQAIIYISNPALKKEFIDPETNKYIDFIALDTDFSKQEYNDEKVAYITSEVENDEVARFSFALKTPPCLLVRVSKQFALSYIEHKDAQVAKYLAKQDKQQA